MKSSLLRLLLISLLPWLVAELLLLLLLRLWLLAIMLLSFVNAIIHMSSLHFSSNGAQQQIARQRQPTNQPNYLSIQMHITGSIGNFACQFPFLFLCAAGCIMHISCLSVLLSIPLILARQLIISLCAEKLKLNHN